MVGGDEYIATRCPLLTVSLYGAPHATWTVIFSWNRCRIWSRFDRVPRNSYSRLEKKNC